jgi:L-lysine 2,3-aminomutase
MSNPKGNPKIKEYGFTTDREESLTAKLSMRITPSMLDKLKQQDDWQELVRQAIAEKLQQSA